MNAATHVGAYRIRPESVHVNQWVYTGVCDTPLQVIEQDEVTHECVRLCLSASSVSSECTNLYRA